MKDNFQAFRIHADKTFERAGIETLSLDQLSQGDVVIQVQYSSVNYKDALAGTGKGKILRQSPLNGGIDLAGVVLSSTNEDVEVGQSVLVNGSGLSEVHDGGYSEIARVPAEWVVPMPAALDARTAMLIGTAGFTAALAIKRLQDNDQTPDKGPILVTGATGGVGSFAIALLKQLGYGVAALTRRPTQHAYLKELGVDEIISSDDIQEDAAPLHKGRFAGAIDNLGGATLAWLTKCIKPWGNIVSIGMASGLNVNTTTMPFILRGVSILGVTSSACQQALRKQTWELLGKDLYLQDFDKISVTEITLAELEYTFEKLLAGEHQGRTIVKL